MRGAAFTEQSHRLVSYVVSRLRGTALATVDENFKNTAVDKGLQTQDLLPLQ